MASSSNDILVETNQNVPNAMEIDDTDDDVAAAAAAAVVPNNTNTNTNSTPQTIVPKLFDSVLRSVLTVTGWNSFVSSEPPTTPTPPVVHVIPNDEEGEGDDDPTPIDSMDCDDDDDVKHDHGTQTKKAKDNPPPSCVVPATRIVPSFDFTNGVVDTLGPNHPFVFRRGQKSATTTVTPSLDQTTPTPTPTVSSPVVVPPTPPTTSGNSSIPKYSFEKRNWGKTTGRIPNHHHHHHHHSYHHHHHHRRKGLSKHHRNCTFPIACPTGPVVVPALLSEITPSSLSSSSFSSHLHPTTTTTPSSSSILVSENRFHHLPNQQQNQQPENDINNNRLFFPTTTTSSSSCCCVAPLGIPDDQHFLYDLQVYLRTHLIEVFPATIHDVVRSSSSSSSSDTNSPNHCLIYGSSPMVVGRVGVRCRYSFSLPEEEESESSSLLLPPYRFPETINDIYSSVQDLYQSYIQTHRHLLPSNVQSELHKLEASYVPRLGPREWYWSDAALKLGLVDTDCCGVGFGRDPNGSLPPLRGTSAKYMESEDDKDGKRHSNPTDGSSSTSSSSSSGPLSSLPYSLSSSVLYVYTYGDTNSSIGNVPRDVQHVIIRDGVTHIDANAFRDCTSLCSIDFSEESTVTSIGAGAFRGCTGLTSVRLPKGLVSVGTRAFYECENLAYVTVGKRLSCIGMEAFACCGSLETFSVLDRDSVTGSLVHEHYNNYYPDSRKTTTTTTTTFPERLLPKLTNRGDPNYALRLTSDETAVGRRAFYNCTLSSVVLPPNITALGSEAFASCHSLRTLEFPPLLVCFPMDAFNNCTSLFEHVPTTFPGSASSEPTTTTTTTTTTAAFSPPQDESTTTYFTSFVSSQGFDVLNLDDLIHSRSSSTTSQPYYYRSKLWNQWASMPSRTAPYRRPLSVAASLSLPWHGGTQEVFRRCMTATYDMDDRVVGRDADGGDGGMMDENGDGDDDGKREEEEEEETATGLAVFMLAATGEESDLECVYRLLREFPPAIAWGVKRDTQLM